MVKSKINLVVVFILFQLCLCYGQNNFNAIAFQLPDNLKELTQKEKELKFASTGQIPDVVFSDKINNANIAFKKTHIPITKDKLGEIKEALVKQFSYTNARILDNKILSLDEKEFTYIKVVVPTPEGNVISINLTTDIEGKMNMITISYLETLKDWELKSQKFIESINVKK
jgi:hypothetical protein